MGKITVKHYLNTNLKPYIIGGEKYYSIYILVTANRQNTKVKSKLFSEYYTEQDFEDITNPNNEIEKDLLANEETAIINIGEMILSELNKFDLQLFAGIYNYYSEIFIWDIDLQLFSLLNMEGEQVVVDLFDPDKNKFGLAIDEFFMESFSLTENQAKGMSLFTWFSKVGQDKLKEYLSKNSVSPSIAHDLNKIVFVRSFKILEWTFKGSKKYLPLIEKYSYRFEAPEFFLDTYYQNFI